MRKSKPLFNKKLMPWKIYRPILAVLLFFFLAGCASKPWTEPLEGTEADSVVHMVNALAVRNATCGGTLEGDLTIFYQNPLEKKAFNGFLQFSKPSFFRFTMENPFGQPVLIIAGDQESFQAIDTLSKNYLAGSIRSFGLRNNIPAYFLQSNWTSLLTGRIQLSGLTITEVREDLDSKGMWLTLQDDKETGVHRLLFDQKQEVILVHIMENKNGQTLAEVNYNDWMTQGTCKQPQEINISKLDYGTNIHLKLTNVLISDKRKTYRLEPPSGYLRHYMP